MSFGESFASGLGGGLADMALGGIAGLFGGKKKNPANQYSQQQLDELRRISGDANTDDYRASYEYGHYQPDDAAARQAEEDRIRFLGNNPWETNQGQALSESLALGPTTQAYKRTREHLIANNARRGFDPGSSMETGQLAQADADYANALAGAQQQAALQSINWGDRASQEVAGIRGRRAAQDVNLARAFSGDRDRLREYIAGSYGGIGAAANQSYSASQAAQNAQYGDIGGVIGEMGGYGRNNGSGGASNSDQAALDDATGQMQGVPGYTADFGGGYGAPEVTADNVDDGVSSGLTPRGMVAPGAQPVATHPYHQALRDHLLGTPGARMSARPWQSQIPERGGTRWTDQNDQFPEGSLPNAYRVPGVTSPRRRRMPAI